MSPYTELRGFFSPKYQAGFMLREPAFQFSGFCLVGFFCVLFFWGGKQILKKEGGEAKYFIDQVA